MKADVGSFCRSCLHCLLTGGVHRIPRPMSHALHSDKRNEVLHFDYLYMGPNRTGGVNALLLNDDASSYVWIEPCPVANAENTPDVLLRWMAFFGVSTNLVSDRGSHFKNQVMDAVNRSLNSHHHFVTPYCPQSNGTVETVCKEVLWTCPAPLSEFRMKAKEWPAICRLIQSILNHTERPSLGSIAPITFFYGIPPHSPLLSILSPGEAQPRSLEFIQAQRMTNTERLRHAVAEVHKDVS